MTDEAAVKRSWKQHWLTQLIAVCGLLYIGFLVYQEYEISSKEPLPVKVSYRDALLGPGYVAQFRNESPRYLAVVVTVKNPTTGQVVSSRLDLPPEQMVEIGHAEGWTFVSGDTITLEHTDYRDWVGLIP
ncbi:MAG: hypothetical protein AAFY56_01295 [Pseudomonadota bacterium]